MASKMYKIVLLIASALVLTAADECKCRESNTKEIEELWSVLAPKVAGLEDTYPFVPGELSPLVPCSNCIEYNRKKRMIQKLEELKREERSPTYFRAWRHANESRNKCPYGYGRVAFLCVKNRL